MDTIEALGGVWMTGKGDEVSYGAEGQKQLHAVRAMNEANVGQSVWMRLRMRTSLGTVASILTAALGRSLKMA